MPKSLLTFIPLPQSENVGLPYTIPEQNRIEPTEPAATSILTVFQELAYGKIGIIDFMPFYEYGDGQPFAFVKAEEDEPLRVSVGKRVSLNYEEFESMRYRTDHDLEEFGRYLTEFYYFTQDTDGAVFGEVELMIFDEDDRDQLADPVVSLRWMITDQGFDLMHS